MNTQLTILSTSFSIRPQRTNTRPTKISIITKTNAGKMTLFAWNKVGKLQKVISSLSQTFQSGLSSAFKQEFGLSTNISAQQFFNQSLQLTVTSIKPTDKHRSPKEREVKLWGRSISKLSIKPWVNNTLLKFV